MFARQQRNRDPYDLLERILSKTALTTKKVTHNDVIDIGENVMKKTHVDIDGMKEVAIQEALEAAERRHARELHASLNRLQKENDAQREKALEKQKCYYVDLAKRVAEQRNKAEEERIREITKKHEKEKDDALRAQLEECEHLKHAAVEEACIALTKRLRDEFAWEKEKAIHDALAIAKEKFKVREAESIAKTRRQCEEEAELKAAQVARQHAQEIKRCEHKFNILHKKYLKEVDHKERVEKDFGELQTDYQRFMDYTDGKYNSDYMMFLRSHGLSLSRKRISTVTYEDIEKIS